MSAYFRSTSASIGTNDKTQLPVGDFEDHGTASSVRSTSNVGKDQSKKPLGTRLPSA